MTPQQNPPGDAFQIRYHIHNVRKLETVKPVLRDHLGSHRNWLLNPIALRKAKTLRSFGLSESNRVKTHHPSLKVHLHCILVQWTLNRWLLKTGGPLIEVTTLAGLTVIILELRSNCKTDPCEFEQHINQL